MSSPLRESIAARIRALRTAKGLTQEQLAERLNRSVDGISMIERGKRWPSLQVLERIAAEVGVQPWELLAPDDEAERRRANLSRLRELFAALSEQEMEAALNEFKGLTGRPR